MTNKNVAQKEIVNVYKNIRNFLLSDTEQLKKVAEIEGQKDIAEKVGGVSISVAKCLLNVFSLGLASSLLEGTKDVVSSIRGKSNEIEEMSKIYDKIVKKAKRTCPDLKTTDEMLQEIYKKYNISKRDSKKLEKGISEHFNMIVSKENEERLGAAEARLKNLELMMMEMQKQQSKQAQINKELMQNGRMNELSKLRKRSICLSEANSSLDRMVGRVNRDLKSHSIPC